MHGPPPLLLTALAAAVLLGAGLIFMIARSDSSAGNQLQGDVNCDSSIDSVDALQVLRSVAGLSLAADCLDAASDVDCNGSADSVDALRILRYLAGLPNSDVPGCPSIGENLEGTPAPSSVHTPTPPPGSATPTPGVTATPVSTPSDTPQPTPRAGAYRLASSGIQTSWSDMVDFALVPGSPDEAAVARQSGKIWKVFRDGRPPVLMGDLSAVVEQSGSEQGLLSLIFSPDFVNDHRLYIYYTANACPQTGASRCHHLSRLEINGSSFDPGAEVIIMEIPVPLNASNHNGSSLRFGHDGMLYVSVGDGGQGGDPLETGQDNTDLLGSVLRLNVTGQDTYSTPGDNPFAGPGNPGNDLVWAYGFRNPWRMSVDQLTGDIWLGDVGQNKWEEVDHMVAGGNYGWDCLEGFESYEPTGCPDPSAFVAPRAAYGHDGENQGVVGGYIYRGPGMPELNGWYIYADFASGRIWAVNPADNSAPILLVDTDEIIYSFAELADGKLLALTVGGGIMALERAP